MFSNLMGGRPTEGIDTGKDCVSAENMLEGTSDVQWDYVFSINTKCLMDFEALR